MTLKVALLAAAAVTGAAVAWLGGTGVFTAWGTWNGATVTLNYSPDGGTTWIACGTFTTLTANGGGLFNLPAGVQLQAAISGAGGSTSLSAVAQVLQGN